MLKKLVTLCLAIAAMNSLQAQTLRIRNNSTENLHIMAVGVDKDNHRFTKTMYDFGQQWKVLSLYEIIYGYDKYRAQEMQHDGKDVTCAWKYLVIYNNSNNVYDTLNITHAEQRKNLANANVSAKIKVAYERGYMITDVILNEE